MGWLACFPWHLLEVLRESTFGETCHRQSYHHHLVKLPGIRNRMREIVQLLWKLEHHLPLAASTVDQIIASKWTQVIKQCV